MKKLTILLMAVILIAGLLAGCWLLPEEKLITITWFEDAKRYNADGTSHSAWTNDSNGPATLIQDDGGYRFADIFDYFNVHVCPDTVGSVVIDETGLLTGWATYTLYGLPTENIFVGEVEIIVYEDETSGTMVGTYTQYKYAYAESLTDYVILIEKYPKAVECAEEGKWFVQYTDYTAYPR